MDRVDRRVLGTGIAAWCLALIFANPAVDFRWGFMAAVFFIPLTLAVLAYQESTRLEFWRGGIPLASPRGISYFAAFVANLYYPSAVVMIFLPLLYLASVQAVWFVLVFFSGGKQPTMRQGRYVPVLYGFLAFTLAIFI